MAQPEFQTPKKRKLTVAMFPNSPLKEKDRKVTVDALEIQAKLVESLETQAERQDCVENAFVGLYLTAAKHQLDLSTQRINEIITAARGDEVIEAESKKDHDLNKFIVREQNKNGEPDSEEEYSEDDDKDREGDLRKLRTNKDMLQTRWDEIVTGLSGMSVNISPTLSKEMMLTYRNDLCQVLAKVRPLVRGRQRLLRPAQIAKIVNFLFTDVFGSAGMARLTNLVKYSVDEGTDVDVGLSTRARNMGNNPAVPVTFQKCFRTLADCVELEKKMVEGIRGFRLNESLVQLRVFYSNCVDELARKDPRMTAAVEAAKVATGKGHDFASQVKEYIILQAQFTRVQLTNLLSQATMVALLVIEFGPGVIPFLPAGAGRTLYDFGVGNFVEAKRQYVKIIAESRDDLTTLCDLVEKHVYSKLHYGERVVIKVPKGGINASMLEKVQKALE